MSTTILETNPEQSVESEAESASAGPAASSKSSKTIIRPTRGWQLINTRELWHHRELLYFLTWRDVKVRYKQTLLGALWAILQPVLMMVVFTVFFGRMAHVPSEGIPYPLFVFAGLLPWTFFATAIASAGNSVVGSERLITKIYFPRLAIPIAAVGAALVDFAIAFCVLLVLMLWYHVYPGVQILLIPVLIAVLALAALGIGTLLAALNVAYRDFRHVIPFLVQLWMFATPTVYMQPVDSGPVYHPVLHFLLGLNPMTGLVAAFRAAILNGSFPWAQAILSTAMVLLIAAVGCFYFRRVEDSFADII